MPDPCPEPLDPKKLNLDFSKMGVNELLIKKAEVRDDAEVMTMRDFADVREGIALESSQMGCDDQRKVVEGVFRFGARTQQFRGCP